jgi:hypothetical protein
MAKQFESWVHGYAAVAEWMGSESLQLAVDITNANALDPVPFNSDVNGWRRAWGAFFRLQPNHENWFHIAIPTPVLVEDRRAGLDRVKVLFRIDNGSLQRVLVFDGPNQIHDRRNLNSSGDHSRVLVDDENVFHVDHDAINFGVGLSLNFMSQQGAGLYIASAGGVFFHNI